jgi:hypothetical protein
MREALVLYQIERSYGLTPFVTPLRRISRPSQTENEGIYALTPISFNGNEEPSIKPW